MTRAERDLEFVTLMAKQGETNNTTKCCATGTCENVFEPRVTSPLIPTALDPMAPSAVRSDLGQLVTVFS